VSSSLVYFSREAGTVSHGSCFTAEVTVRETKGSGFEGKVQITIRQGSNPDLVMYMKSSANGDPD
jgi:hypothetical protein